MLTILNLSKKFHNKLILDNLSCTIQAGEIALFLGASGSGKSTLLRILNNLERADTGSIKLNGKALSPNELSRDHQIGMVFQQYNLFENMTALENVTFALEKSLGKKPDEAEQVGRHLLKKYALEEQAHLYPYNLSGGQKQRLALARTLALEPAIICLDEPTSALDPLLTNYVAQTIADLAQQGFIVIVASHDTKLIEQLNCTIYLLSRGHLVEKGSSDEVRKDPASYPAIANFIKGKV